MLYTVNKARLSANNLESVLRVAQAGSPILLYEDGVYAAMKGTAAEGKVKSAQGVKFYVLGPDLKARGLSADRVTDGIEIVDYAGFVDLAAEHGKVVAWV